MKRLKQKRSTRVSIETRAEKQFNNLEMDIEDQSYKGEKDEMNSQLSDIELEADEKGNQRLDNVTDSINALILKNKINQRNAFEVPVTDIKDLQSFKGTYFLLSDIFGDIAWKKLSSTLENGAKIYGYRVDSVHNETYKIMGGISRTDFQETANDEDSKKGEDEIQKRIKKSGLNGVSTLEKCVNNLELKTYDKGQELDPVFMNATSQFDEAGTKGLLQHNLNVGDLCKLIISSQAEKIQERSSGDERNIKNDFRNCSK